MRFRTLKRRRNSGFTLIELLTVIAIMGVLAALIAAAVHRVSAAQVQRRTEQNIVKIASALDQQWQVVISQAKKNTVAIAPNNGLFGSAGNDRDRAQVVWVKANLLLEFPQSFSEVQTTDLTVFTPSTGAIIQNTYKQNYLDYINGATAGASPPQYEAAVCLYMALTQTRAGMGAFDPEQALQGGVTTLTVGGKAFKVFVDGWGNPISFVRWPLGSTELNTPAFCANLNLPDPQDPSGKLQNLSASLLSSLSGAQSALHTFGPPYGPTGLNLVPVVVSAGRNGQFGISFAQNSGLAPDGSGYDNDNLYSYRLRQDGGRGN